MSSTAGPSIVDTTDDGVIIEACSPEQPIMPGASLLDGFLSFALPRDGRFGDVSEPPAAILLFPPGGTRQWSDVEGQGTSPSKTHAPIPLVARHLRQVARQRS